MKTKQLYIDLINNYLNRFITLSDFADEYQKNVLREKSASVYVPYLISLNELIQQWFADSTNLSNEEFKVEIIKVLDILNTPVKELEKQGADKVKQREIEEYQASLPLTMIRLMSEAEKEGITYQVIESNYLPGVYGIIFNDRHRDIQEFLYSNSKESYDVLSIELLIDNSKEARLISEHKANILKSAKEKLKQTLTEEELNILKENGI